MKDRSYIYLENATAYAARTQNEETPGVSFTMAAVRRAVEATRWGQFPRCSHTETKAIAWRLPRSMSWVLVVSVAG